MPDFLTHTLALYSQHLSSWHRDERRLFGGDAVLEELRQWKGETSEDWQARQEQAGYITLPKLHATTLTGHLSGQTPMPEFAEMGAVRERAQLKGAKSKAELLWYNVDGIGQDGSEMMPWFDGVQERALATGYRWVLVEKPSQSVLDAMRTITPPRADGKLRGDEIERGFRPYAVEYSPTEVPFWQFTSGRLDCAIIRIPLIPASLVDAASTDLGYYLLVRQGFAGLGETYAVGGWWKFNSDQALIEEGRWDQALQGQIPLFLFLGEPSTGTSARPALARPLLMELGQIAVSLMVLRSARDYNILQAAKSVNWILGINPDEHGAVIRQQELGGITYGVPPVMLPDGKVGIPSIWNSSASLMDSQAFESVIKSSFEEAHEIMVKQVTSTPDSSGRSKEAGFAEATSPLLARLAATRQQALNTFLYFAALRFGIANPTASVTIPREFDLAPVIDDIDDMLARLKRSWLRSPTLERLLLLRAADERGMMPEDQAERDLIEQELTDSGMIPTDPLNPLADDLPTTPGRQPKAAPTTPPGNQGPPSNQGTPPAKPGVAA